MKICIATSSFPGHPGDSMRAPFLLGSIAALRAQGCEIHVLTQAVPGARGGFDFPVTHYPWAGASSEGAVGGLLRNPLKAGWRILSLLLAGRNALRALHARERFDVVLCCWAVPAGFYARLARVPYATWSLGSDVNALKNFFATRAILRWVLRGARARFADGLSLAEEVSRISGLDCEFLPTFRGLGVKAVVPLPSAVPTEILYIGRHDPVKGVDLLIDAFGKVARDFPAAKLLIGGDGPLEAALRGRAEALGLGSRIEFLGRVPEDQLAAVYARAHAIVIPSRSESIPLVLGEAVQLGKPVVATDVGDMGRLVREYGLGVVAGGPDVTLLALALTELLSGRVKTDRSRCQAFLDLLSFEKKAPRLISFLRPREQGARTE